MNEEKRTIIQKRMDEVLPKGDWKIFNAISYTPKSGGKNLRAMIMLNMADDLGVDDMLDAAVAVELFHSGTLIHDDMPEIDDATMRRGKKANHVVFGPGMALLAGDGLFFLAFKLISKYKELFSIFSDVAYDVLIGEAMDVEMEDRTSFSENDIFEMYDKKTGALFGFSLSAPVVVKGLKDWKEFEKVGRKFGVAFQIYDDIKDITMDSESIGKDVGKDINKKTLVKVLGIKRARKMADEILRESLDFLRLRNLEKTKSFLEKSLEMIKRG